MCVSRGCEAVHAVLLARSNRAERFKEVGFTVGPALQSLDGTLPVVRALGSES